LSAGPMASARECSGGSWARPTGALRPRPGCISRPPRGASGRHHRRAGWYCPAPRPVVNHCRTAGGGRRGCRRGSWGRGRGRGRHASRRRAPRRTLALGAAVQHGAGGDDPVGPLAPACGVQQAGSPANSGPGGGGVVAAPLWSQRRGGLRSRCVLLLWCLLHVLPSRWRVCGAGACPTGWGQSCRMVRAPLPHACMRGFVRARLRLGASTPCPPPPSALLADAGLVRSVSLWAPAVVAPGVLPAPPACSDHDDDAVAAHAAVVLLRWLARALRILRYPMGTLLRRRSFHAAAAKDLATGAVATLQARAAFPGHPGSGAGAGPALAARSLAADTTRCRALATGALQEAYVACRWLPKVRGAGSRRRSCGALSVSLHFHRLPPPPCPFFRSFCTPLQTFQRSCVSDTRAALRHALHDRGAQLKGAAAAALLAQGQRSAAAIARAVDHDVVPLLPLPDGEVLQR
jgi:hypothetical protein